MRRVETILVFALAIALTGCVTGGKPPVVQAAAPPVPQQPLSVPQTQVQLPPEQPLNPDALATPQTPPGPQIPPQEPPRRPAATPKPEPAATTPPSAPVRAPLQDIVPATVQKQLQDEAISRRRETRHLLDLAKTRALNSREKSSVRRIESFLQQSDLAEKRNDMRQASSLADKALALARELPSAK